MAWDIDLFWRRAANSCELGDGRMTAADEGHRLKIKIAAETAAGV